MQTGNAVVHALPKPKVTLYFLPTQQVHPRTTTLSLTLTLSSLPPEQKREKKRAPKGGLETYAGLMCRLLLCLRPVGGAFEQLHGVQEDSTLSTGNKINIIRIKNHD